MQPTAPLAPDVRGFPATMWTVLLTARDPAAPEARAAREAVCAAYCKEIAFAPGAPETVRTGTGVGE